MKTDRRSFRERHPLLVALLVGYSVFVVGFFVFGTGILAGPFAAGFVFGKNITASRPRPTNIWLKGAKAGALLAIPMVLIGLIYILYGALQESLLGLAVAGVVAVITAVLVLLSVALGAVGAWLSQLGSGPPAKPDRWENPESADPWASRGSQT